MAKYIEREAAIDALQNHYEVRNAVQNGIMDECVMLMMRVPAADVVRVRHGRWKKAIEDDKYYHMECSRCCGRPLRSRWADDAVLSTFCPWCGALMDKDGDGE